MANPWSYYRRLIMTEGRRSLANVTSSTIGSNIANSASPSLDTTTTRETYITCQQGEDGDADGSGVEGTSRDAQEMARRRRKNRVNSGVFAPQRYFDNLPPAK